LCTPHAVFGAGQIVAVGSTYGETQPDAAEEDRPLILIGSEDGWQRVDAGGVVAGSLMGLSADPSGRIWAFGASASSPLLLSSHDGTSWTDTSAPLARVAPDQVPVAIAFQTDLVGWIATRGLLAGGGPQLFRTEDAGRTWVPVEHTGSKHVFGTYALRIPQGDRDVVELVVSNPDSVSVRTVSKDGVRVETIASAHEMRAWAFVSVADTWWMFGRKDGCAARNESCVEEVGGAVQVDFPAIRRVDAKRAALDRLIDAPTWTDIRAGHFFDTQIGIAGGQSVGSNRRRAVLLRTTDGGASWERGVLPDTVAAGGGIAAVVLTNAQEGWAAFNYGSRPGTVLLRTTDGGQHWTETSGGFALGRLRALLASGD
jgi:hypothetical protein